MLRFGSGSVPLFLGQAEEPRRGGKWFMWGQLISAIDWPEKPFPGAEHSCVPPSAAHSSLEVRLYQQSSPLPSSGCADLD